MRRRLALLALACAAFAAASAHAAPAATCVNLKVDASVRPALEHAHSRKRDGGIEKGSIYYGRCGSTSYAIATFSKALADQPEKFRRLAGHGWSDFGDGFEDGCSRGARYPVPAALVRLWHVCQQLG
jgi:hypothetical protein